MNKPIDQSEFVSAESVSEPNAQKAKLPAVIEPPQRKSEEFDWNDDDIVLREQRCTAIYWNPAGDLAIRQGADWDESDDPFLVIGANNVQDFIDRLCDVARIPSAGKRS